MSSDISRIIKVNITRQTTAVDQKGFGTGLILGRNADKPAAITTRTRTYFTLDGVLDDFAATSPVYLAAQAYFGQALKPTQVVIGFREEINSTLETVAEALNAIKDENDDWYAVGMISSVQADQEALAAYINTDCRIAAVRSKDTGILGVTTTDIAASLANDNFDRTFVIYSSNSYDSVADDGDQFAEFAWLGEILPKLPGVATWAFKTLSGITVDKVTGTQIVNLKSKNANWYHVVGGVAITENGTMASGEFIDIIRSTDFIQARMQEAIYSRMVNLDKIPYTNAGVDLIVNEMAGVLQRAVEVNTILRADPFPTIQKPDVRNLPFNDRANRCLPDIKFFGEFAGAVHKICIDGTISV